jgi:hypothetical protein
MSTELPAPMGHNNPPEVTEIMAQEQKSLYADKIAEINRLIAKEAEVPAAIEDDESLGKAGDFKKLVKALIKEADAIRMVEKKKYTVKSDAIQNFWKKSIAPLESAIERIDARMGPYLKRKEDEKRRAAEEKAAEDKRKADEALRIAREAEEAAVLKAQEAAREAARIEAENEAKRKEAEAAAQKIRDEALFDASYTEAIAEDAARTAKAARDLILAQQAEQDRQRKERQDQEDRDRAAEQAAKDALKAAEQAAKDADKNLKNVSRETKTIVKDAEKEAKDVIKEARAEIADAGAEVHELHKDAQQATRTANRALDTAVRADREHARSEKQTLAGSAALSRTRGFGSISSISETWTGEVQSRDELLHSAAAIWEHIPMDALNQAVRAWVRANEGNRQLRGALIYQETKTNVR